MVMNVMTWAWGGCVLGRWPVRLGGWGRISGIASFRYTMINQFRGGSHTGGVPITEASVCMYTEEHKCQLCHSRSEPVALFALLR